MSELRVKDLSPRAQEIIRSYTDEVPSDPVNNWTWTMAPPWTSFSIAPCGAHLLLPTTKSWPQKVNMPPG
ncbi:hypothetical protein [Chitinophaga sedimenti]|uniref:hypothetical protein n=1 Tax=Chitinophaga sedimenti TaxID=2033606 RepID=UPI0035591CC5